MANPYQDGCAWIAGEYVPIEEARIPITDMGFSRSDVTYDVVAVWHGKFFRLDDHLDRFERSWTCVRMQPPVTRTEMRRILFDCVRYAELREAYVEMICSRGVPPPGERDPRKVANRFYAFALPYVWLVQPAQQVVGIPLVVATSTERTSPRAVDPTVKNFQWGDLVRGLFEAYDRGAHTAVLLNAEGMVTEGPGFNLFAYYRGILLTPAGGVLEGITRRTVLELATAESSATRVTMFDAETLRAASEVFITSTAGGVMPVTTLDGVAVGSGAPGPLTMRLRERYWAAHEGGPWTEAVAYGTPVRQRQV